MITIPTDSTDAREQRELEAARAASDAEQAEEHAKVCRGGWLGLDIDDRPIPCPRCRPHLLHVPCRTCCSPWQSCDHLKIIGRGPCCDDCNHDPKRAA